MHVYGHAYECPLVCDGTQELRRGIQAEGYHCCRGRKQADGKKLKACIVFKGKGSCLTKDLSKITGVAAKFSENGWMNDELTAVYLHSIFGPLSFSKRLLVRDAYKCPTSDAARRETNRLKLHTAVVPRSLFRHQMSFGTLVSIAISDQAMTPGFHSLL